MDYDSITVDPAYPDWSWTPWALIACTILLVVGVVLLQKHRRNAGQSWTLTSSAMCLVLGAFGLLMAVVLPPVLTGTTIEDHQEAALIKQQGFTSAEVHYSLLRKTSTFTAQTAEGTFVKGELEPYRDNVYVVIPDER